MPEPIDPLERRLRDDLGDAGRIELPPVLRDHVRRTIRSTAQVRRSSGWAPWAAVAAVLVVAVIAGAPLLYGTLVAPGRTAAPTAAPSVSEAPSPTAAGTIPPTAPSTASPTPVASPGPASTPPSTPRPTPFGSASTSFDLRKTAWRLVELPGLVLGAETTPSIDFKLSLTGAAPASAQNPALGWNGCNFFSFKATLSGGRISGLTIDRHDDVCRALDIRAAFMALLPSMTRWVVIGDFLVLTGPGGTLELLRDLPPVGDPGRALADALGRGQWRIASATGVKAPGVFVPVVFSDRYFITDSTRFPSCGGVSGPVEFRAGGAITVEAGFDTIYCGEGDERAEITTVLNQATSGTLESPTRVRLSGPNGEVVLVKQ